MDALQQEQRAPSQTAGERKISITEQERQLLTELLTGEIAALRSEIYHAESHDVKVLLKEREACAKNLLDHFQ